MSMLKTLFNGKKTLVVFRSGGTLMPDMDDRGDVSTFVLRKGNDATLVPMQFILCKIIDVAEDGIVVEYNEKDLREGGSPSRKYTTFIARDNISAITFAAESKIAIVGGTTSGMT